MDKDYYVITAALQKDHWWYEGRRRIIGAMIERAGLPSDAKILEAGCGPGANLALLSRYGEVCAFEPEEFARIHAAKTSGVRVEEGFLPEPVPYDGPFDLTCAFDVIEHIDDDLASLKTLLRLTKPGGAALFTVPAFAFLWSKHDEVNHHKRRYTKKQFVALLREAGFEVTFASYCNMCLFPAALGARVIQNILKSEGDGDVHMPRLPFVNAILRSIFASERFLLRFFSLPFGLSVVALCRRPDAGR